MRKLLLAISLAGCAADRHDSTTRLIEPQSPPVLRAGAFKVCWEGIEAPRVLPARAHAEFVVTIRNCSDAVWPDPQMGDPVEMMGSHAVRLVHRWRDANGPIQPRWGNRSDLPWPLLPGRTIELPVRVIAPSRRGHYQIELDLVQENVAWFGEQTGVRPTVPVEVR